MQPGTRILRQRSLPLQADGFLLDLFGKRFLPRPAEDVWRIVIHEDFPLIGERDAEEFARFAQAAQAPRTGVRWALSARPVPVQSHPYRQLCLGPDGRERHVHDVAQDVRGDRHRYPPAWEIVPALVAIPPGMALAGGPDPVVSVDLGPVALYVLPGPKLLDRTRLLDRIRLASLASAALRAA
jgi:hypothetical protein